MKTESEHVQRWEDIIFEKRNKEYGAYSIRKNYNSNVLKAEAISIGIGLLIFIIPILIRDEKILIPSLPKDDDGIVLQPIKNIEPFITPPPAPQPPRRIDASIIPTRVVTTPVEPEPVTQPTNNEVTYTSNPVNSSLTTNAGNGVTVGAGAETEVESTKVFIYVERMPEYEGGDEAMMKFIQKKTRYPSKARIKGDQGIVFIQFVVRADGSVTDVKVVKGVSKECDEEAVRVISLMNKWKPGVQNGKAVAVSKVLPLNFRLE